MLCVHCVRVYLSICFHSRLLLLLCSAEALVSTVCYVIFRNFSLFLNQMSVIISFTVRELCCYYGSIGWLDKLINSWPTLRYSWDLMPLLGHKGIQCSWSSFCVYISAFELSVAMCEATVMDPMMMSHVSVSVSSSILNSYWVHCRQKSVNVWFWLLFFFLPILGVLICDEDTSRVHIFVIIISAIHCLCCSSCGCRPR